MISHRPPATPPRSAPHAPGWCARLPGALLLALALLLPLPSPRAAADPPPGNGERKRVVLVESMPVPPVVETSAAFVKHLRAAGYAPGRNLDLVVLRPQGDRERARRMVEEALAAGPVDLLVTSATIAAQAALKARQAHPGSAIPQLFFTVSDPVGAGLVSRLDAPAGHHITGLVHTVPRTTKLTMLLRMLEPLIQRRPVRFGIIHSDYPSSMGDVRLLREAAATVGGCAIIPHQVPYRPVPEGLPAMLEAVREGIHALEERVDYWIEPSGPLGETAAYTRLLRDNSRHAIVYGTNMGSVRLGAMLHVTPSSEGSGREAARRAVAILQGTDAGTLPVTTPLDLELGINLATVLQLGAHAPSDLVELAGAFIFRQRAP